MRIVWFFLLKTLLLTCSCTAENLSKQLWPRQGPTKRRAWSGSELFDTLMVFLKDVFEKNVLILKVMQNYPASKSQKNELHVLGSNKAKVSFGKLQTEFGSRSGPTRCRAWSGSNFVGPDLDPICLRLWWYSWNIFEPNQQTTEKNAGKGVTWTIQTCGCLHVTSTTVFHFTFSCWDLRILYISKLVHPPIRCQIMF